MGDVLFPGPHQLDRPAHIACDQRRLGGVVGERAAAEAPAHVALMHLDLVRPEAERLRHQLTAASRVLGSVPDLDPIAGLVEASDGVQRFHLRVVAVVAEVVRLIDFGGAGERRPYVAPGVAYPVVPGLAKYGMVT